MNRDILTRRLQQRGLEMDASAADLAAIRAFVREALARLGASETVQDHGELVIDELCSNSLTHGYHDGHGYLRIDVERAGDTYRIAFADRAGVFNPTSTPTAPVAGDIGDRPVGGLGLHLVRESTRALRYRRVDNENQTTATL